MKSRAKAAVASSLFVLFGLDGLVLLGWLLGDRGSIPRNIWFGIVVGVVVGSFWCLYLAITWDVKRLRHRGATHTIPDFRWLPFAVIGGLLTARLIGGFASEQFTGFLGTLLIVVANVVILYMMLQVTRHHLLP
jgi:uncharacterized membrane protein YfcA